MAGMRMSSEELLAKAIQFESNGNTSGAERAFSLALRAEAREHGEDVA